jgi:hypothetical protein
MKRLRHEKISRDIAVADVFLESRGNRIVTVWLHRNLLSAGLMIWIVRIQKVPSERITIIAKPEHVYQGTCRAGVVQTQSANRNTTKSAQQRTAQIDKKRFGQRTLRRNNEYKKNVQLPESP